jgi:hypothetical protein
MMRKELNKEFETARILSEDLLGRPVVSTTSFEEVLRRLREGEQGIIAEIPWGEIREGERYERLQIVLMELQDDRITYINPLPRIAGALGDAGGGEETGPLRTLKPDGYESMPLNVFQERFKSGGRALL